MTVVDVPYEIPGILRAKRGDTRVRIRETVAVDVRDVPSGRTDGTVDYTDHALRARTKVVVHEDRAWFPCLWSPDASGLGSLRPVVYENYDEVVASALSRPGIKGRDLPFSMRDMVRSESSLSTAERKAFIPPGRHAEVEISEDARTSARAIAEADADDMLFVDGRLHCSVEEPVLLRNSGSLDSWAFTLGEVRTRSNPNTRMERSMSFAFLPHSQRNEIMEVMGIAPQDLAGSRAGFILGDPTFDTIARNPTRLRAFDRSLLSIVSSTLESLVPPAQALGLVGSGDLAQVDVPEALDEALFEGRRILRALQGADRRNEPFGDLSFRATAWLERFREELLRASKLHRTETTRMSWCLTPIDEIEGWWNAIERPRLTSLKTPAVAKLDVNDESALTGFSL